MARSDTNPLVAIACGGTGGHLFPGLAVAEVLRDHGCDLQLLVSPKEVDQEAVKSAVGMEIVTLPAVALQRGSLAGFVLGAWRSYRLCRRRFRARPPRAVLAMGGFTSAPPVMAGKKCGALTFIHEANAIPGRANRWLAPRVDEAFVTYPMAARRLRTSSTVTTGMPVRSQFRAADPGPCRMALGLHPERPVLLVTGGSQGACAINALVVQALPALIERAPQLQLLHLTGTRDFAGTRRQYADHKCRAQVLPFLTEMDLALGAATVVISRAGASSIAEIAALRRPSILIPYPSAADNHQFHNAQALVQLGAARLLPQADAGVSALVEAVSELLGNEPLRSQMAASLERWHAGNAAENVAARMLNAMGLPAPQPLAGGSDESLASPPGIRSRLDAALQMQS